MSKEKLSAGLCDTCDNCQKRQFGDGVSEPLSVVPFCIAWQFEVEPLPKEERILKCDDYINNQLKNKPMENNNIKITIQQPVEVGVAQIATNLAEKDSKAQAELLNEFSTALVQRCEDTNDLNMQLSYIVDSLDIHGKQLIRELAAFIELKNLT